MYGNKLEENPKHFVTSLPVPEVLFHLCIRNGLFIQVIDFFLLLGNNTLPSQACESP